MFHSIYTKRGFAKMAFELGHSIPTASLAGKPSKFYNLVPLEGIEQALEAPEETLVVNLPGPSNYDKLFKDVEELKKRNSVEVKLNDSIVQLQKEVKILQIGPAVIQIYETVKEKEQLLIENYSKFTYNLLRPSDRRISYLRNTENPGNEFSDFFENPLVLMIENLTKTSQWKKLEKKRNEIAHEPIEKLDNIEPIWQKIVDAELCSDSGFGAEIRNICEQFEILYPSKNPTN